jgi:hypothetical protein
MKRHSCKSGSSVRSLSPEFVPQASSHLNWSMHPELISSRQECKADTWVQLLELPSPFSHDEALLLCQHSEDKWIAWIPNHGEAILHASQFCLAK